MKPTQVGAVLPELHPRFPLGVGNEMVARSGLDSEVYGVNVGSMVLKERVLVMVLELEACFLFYVLATAKVISGEELTCDSVHLIVLPHLGHQHHDLISHIEPTSPCPSY